MSADLCDTELLCTKGQMFLFPFNQYDQSVSKINTKPVLIERKQV